MKPKALYIVPHTHWDREWYLSFPKHRYKLVKLMDSLIAILESDKEFACFHLDGQMLILEDYLAIRPSMRERVTRLIKDKRLRIGAFYILQDEYLISGEANIRNITYGLKSARQFGTPDLVGYFPDAFGNIGQMPQILKGFGIDSAFFGRGIIPIGYANEILGKADNGFSEIIWQSPDDSEVIGVQFVHWYNNASELELGEEMIPRFNSIINSLTFAGKTPYLLGMNGCDHQPVQQNLTEVVREANKHFDLDIKIAGLPEYVDKIRPYKDTFYRYKGEINNEDSVGFGTLINTASARIYLKQLNHKSQHNLENRLEPLSVLNRAFGGQYDREIIDFSWRKLLENHAHDSICACSCDEVCREMQQRFCDVVDTTEMLIEDTAKNIVDKIDTSGAQRTVVVFNTDIKPQEGVIKTELEFDLDEQIPSDLVFVNEDGEQVLSHFGELEVKKRFYLPEDTFRVIKDVKVLPVEIYAHNKNVLGYDSYRLTTGDKAVSPLKVDGMCAENQHIILQINGNGSFSMLLKSSNKRYDNLNTFEDVGDVGDLYGFVEAGQTITTAKSAAKASIVVQNPLYVTYLVENILNLPISADKESRTRNEQTMEFGIKSFITVKAFSPLVEIRTEFDNNVCDHRLRAVFKVPLNTRTNFAEGQFDFVERKNKPGDKWKNPSNCQRMDSLMYLEEQENGLVVAGRGLNEYEIVNDNVCLTLLRGVAEMGDWFYFPTPEGQCAGAQYAEYAVGAFCRDTRQSMLDEGFSFSRPKLLPVVARAHEGTLARSNSYLDITTEGSVFYSAFKSAEEQEADVIRVYNPSCKSGKIIISNRLKALAVARLDESNPSTIEYNDGYTIDVPPKKIITVLLQK